MLACVLCLCAITGALTFGVIAIFMLFRQALTPELHGMWHSERVRELVCSGGVHAAPGSTKFCQHMKKAAKLETGAAGQLKLLHVHACD